jgi:hypothetical protein
MCLRNVLPLDAHSVVSNAGFQNKSHQNQGLAQESLTLERVSRTGKRVIGRGAWGQMELACAA